MSITTPSALQGPARHRNGPVDRRPFAGKTLGEFGADVIKIEAPGAGDPLRNWRLIKDGTSVWWQVQSRNKRSIALDLRSAEGQDIARKLIAEADVLIENFRPGTLEGWGMGYEALSKLNPGLVMLRISGYGQTGPYRDLPGFGAIGEAMGGLRHLTGEPGRVPVRCGISIGDTLAALARHDRHPDRAVPPQGERRAGAGDRRGAQRSGVQRDGEPDPGVQRLRRGARGRRQRAAGHRAVECLPLRRRLRADRRQWRQHLQAADADDRPRRSGLPTRSLPTTPGASRVSPNSTWRSKPGPLRNRSSRCSNGSGRRKRAGRQGLHRKGHRRRPALPGARHDLAPANPRRLRDSTYRASCPSCSARRARSVLPRRSSATTPTRC